MNKIWVLVADASRARVFTADKPAGPLNEVEALSNPEARLHEGDIVSDRSGHVMSGNGGGHNLGSKDQAKEEVANRFAAEVCKQLEKGRTGNAFAKLYVVASPAFLGLMRKHQSDALRELISDEIAKDLSRESPDRIRAQLPEYL
ncbi:MAG: host attachment protein [Sedimenticolaceae bacterium]